MLAILGLIPTVLTALTGLGSTASSISKDIRDLQIAKENTRSNVRLKEIDAEIAAVNARKDVLVAEAGSRLNATMRWLIALGPATYIFKYFFIDKFVGSLVGCSISPTMWHCGIFRTDPVNTEMAVVVTAVLAFFFLTSSVKK